MSERESEILSYPVRNYDQYHQEILEKLVSLRKGIKPDVVIGPSQNDVHPDHQIISNEMIRTFKTSSSILCYELPWNHTTFHNQCFSKLDEKFVKRKIDLLSCYHSQVNLNRNYFSPDYITGWARMRGIHCNADYAETFEVIKVDAITKIDFPVIIRICYSLVQIS